jgi:hypothetical protein
VSQAATVTIPVRSEEMMKPHRDHPARDNITGAWAAADDRVLEISHAQMDAAHNNGEAIPFAQSVPWLVRYDGSWWVVYERGWLRITDELTATDIDQRAAQVPKADKPDAARQ